MAKQSLLSPVSGNWSTYAASGEGVARGRQLLDGLPAQQTWDFVRQVSELG